MLRRRHGQPSGAWVDPLFFFFSSRRRHTRSLCDWSSDVCSSDLPDVSAAEAIRHVGARAALQGNLDPCVLFAPADVVEHETNRVLDEFAEQAGYVFNLGSGILPKTPVASMEAIFRAVKARRAGS